MFFFSNIQIDVTFRTLKILEKKKLHKIEKKKTIKKQKKNQKGFLRKKNFKVLMKQICQ